MNQSFPQSALHTAAFALRGIWAAVLCRFGRLRPEPDEQAVADWVGGILRRLEELLGQYRAAETVAFGDAARDDADYDDAGLDGWQPIGVSPPVRARMAGADGRLTRDQTYEGGSCAAHGADETHDHHSNCGVATQSSQTLPERREISGCIAPWWQRGVTTVAFFQKSAIGTQPGTT